MSNHFHLVFETPRSDLVAGMKWLLGTYTMRFNVRHKTCGHLFSGRYKALPVDGSRHGYLQTACDYVHLNPVRAKLLATDQPLESFPWSSYVHYLGDPKSRPDWLRVDRLFGEKGIRKDSPAGRLEFARRMIHKAKCQPDGEEYCLDLGGWFVGDEAFKKELLAAMEGKAGPNHFGEDRRETTMQLAERLVQEHLTELGWTENDLKNHPKGEPGKLEIAQKLRAATSLTLEQIAKRLHMGGGGYVYNLLRKKLKLERAAGD